MLDDQKQITPKQFLENLEAKGIEISPVLASEQITLTEVFENQSPVGVYEASGFFFALYDIPHQKPVQNFDGNNSVLVTQKMNLFIVGIGQAPLEFKLFRFN